MNDRFECQLGTSRYLLGFFLLCHTGAIIGISCAGLPLFLVFVLVILLSIHFYYVMRFHVWRNLDNAAVSIWIDEKNRWGFKTKDGQQHLAVLMQDSIRTSFIFILRLQSRTKIKNIVIPLDALSDHNYRRLSAHLFTA